MKSKKAATASMRFWTIWTFLFTLIVFITVTGSTVLAQEEVKPEPEKKALPAHKEILVADFEEATPEGSEVLRTQVEVVKNSEKCPAGKGYLKAVVPEDNRRAAQLLFTLPESSNLSFCKHLSAYFKLPEIEGEWKLRWNVLDKDKNQIYQRMFRVEGTGKWSKTEWPLALWRWSNSRVGDWSEAKYLVLNIEQGDGTVGLDDIRLVPGERASQSAMPKPGWAATIAFPGGFRSVNEDGFFLATNAKEDISDEDLQSLLKKVAPIRKWLRATLKKALRPVGGDAPVSLLIFKELDQYKSFYERLGKAWNVSIGAPGAGGYTVQDIAASGYKPSYGIDRPVYFHELVHAVVCRELRLMPGQRRHSWLQEGFANYLQLCLYPKSLSRESYVRNFAKPITNRSFFKPLERLLTRPIAMRNYAQLASLTAFLATEHADWLDKIAGGIADGRNVGDVLDDFDMDFDKLQDAWVAWGRKQFAPGSEPQAGPGTIFALPAQWKEEPEKQGAAGEEEIPKGPERERDF